VDNRRLKMDGYGNRIVFFIIKFVVLVGLIREYLRNKGTGGI
jgi:hypothetical protein